MNLGLSGISDNTLINIPSTGQLSPLCSTLVLLSKVLALTLQLKHLGDFQRQSYFLSYFTPRWEVRQTISGGKAAVKSPNYLSEINYSFLTGSVCLKSYLIIWSLIIGSQLLPCPDLIMESHWVGVIWLPFSDSTHLLWNSTVLVFMFSHTGWN